MVDLYNAEHPNEPPMTVETSDENPLTNVDWVEVDSLEEGMDHYRICLLKQLQKMGKKEWLNAGGVMRDGYLPVTEMEHIRAASREADAVFDISLATTFASSVGGYSFDDFVDLASQMRDTGGNNAESTTQTQFALNWSVEADMQLSELITRSANRERVTPQNLSCSALERTVGTLDLNVSFSLLVGVPMRRLLARASMMRVANQVLVHTLPYFSVSTPEEKWQYSRQGAEEEYSTMKHVAPTSAKASHLYHNTVCTCSSSPNAVMYNNFDSKSLCTPVSSKISKFPDDIGIEQKLRDVTEIWRPICTARRLRLLRRLVFSATKRSFWESIIDATTTVTPLHQDEYWY